MVEIFTKISGWKCILTVGKTRVEGLSVRISYVSAELLVWKLFSLRIDLPYCLIVLFLKYSGQNSYYIIWLACYLYMFPCLNIETRKNVCYMCSALNMMHHSRRRGGFVSVAAAAKLVASIHCYILFVYALRITNIATCSAYVFIRFLWFPFNFGCGLYP